MTIVTKDGAYITWISQAIGENALHMQGLANRPATNQPTQPYHFRIKLNVVPDGQLQIPGLRQRDHLLSFFEVDRKRFFNVNVTTRRKTLAGYFEVTQRGRRNMND